MKFQSKFQILNTKLDFFYQWFDYFSLYFFFILTEEIYTIFYIRAKNLFLNNFNIFLIWSPGPRRARPVRCAWSVTWVLRVVIGIRIGCVFRVNQISNWKNISLLWNNRRLVNSYYIDHFAPFCWRSPRVLITDWRYRSDQVRNLCPKLTLGHLSTLFWRNFNLYNHNRVYKYHIMVKSVKIWRWLWISVNQIEVLTVIA